MDPVAYSKVQGLAADGLCVWLTLFQKRVCRDPLSLSQTGAPTTATLTTPEAT